MKDTIYREDAIDALCDNCDNVQAVCPHYPCKQYTTIEALPSAQPEPPEPEELDFVQPHKKIGVQLEIGRSEIIRCKDCKYSDENWRRVSVRWLPCMDMRTGSNWFCGSAERRTNG